MCRFLAIVATGLMLTACSSDDGGCEQSVQTDGGSINQSQSGIACEQSISIGNTDDGKAAPGDKSAADK